MVQAQGIMLRDNVRTIGHMIRLYTNKNSTLNGTGKSQQHLFIITIAAFPLPGQGRAVLVRARASRVSTVTSGA